MKFDFTPFGYAWALPSKSMVTDLHTLATIVESDTTHLVTKKGTYTYKQLLGKGSYGTTYRAVHNGKDIAIKQLRPRNSEELWDAIKETILQILLYHETKKQKDGPYVPEIYEIAYDPKEKQLFMIQEMMDGTFESLIKSRTKLENETHLPQEFQTIASQLEWLGQHLQFNHRDFKSDNIMYKQHGSTYELRLIDFGQSCMTWHGHVLSAASYIFPTTRKCYRKSRDLTALFFEIAVYEGSYISKKTRELLHTMTTFYVHGKKIDMIKNMNWNNTYNFLNGKNVENPKAVPTTVRKTIKSPKPIRRTTRKHVRSYTDST